MSSREGREGPLIFQAALTAPLGPDSVDATLAINYHRIYHPKEGPGYKMCWTAGLTGAWCDRVGVLPASGDEYDKK